MTWWDFDSTMTNHIILARIPVEKVYEIFAWLHPRLKILLSSTMLSALICLKIAKVLLSLHMQRFLLNPRFGISGGIKQTQLKDIVLE